MHLQSPKKKRKNKTKKTHTQKYALRKKFMPNDEKNARKRATKCTTKKKTTKNTQKMHPNAAHFFLPPLPSPVYTHTWLESMTKKNFNLRRGPSFL